MPMMEFCCTRCENTFETLVRAGEEAACPKCGSADLKRLISRFAARSNSPAGASKSIGGKSCSSCSSGSCSSCA
ncbi:MAG: zinc ribbon domain-containing protein [Firmicutes bacterium]|nr:zinc ribbon domain-containing protein [Bacillota bacterium]